MTLHGAQSASVSGGSSAAAGNGTTGGSAGIVGNGGQTAVETSSAAAAAAAAAANSYAAATFRNAAALNGLHPYTVGSYEAAAAAAAACAWANRLDPSAATLGRLDAAGFQAGLAASQATAFRRSGKCVQFLCLCSLSPYSSSYGSQQQQQFFAVLSLK